MVRFFNNQSGVTAVLSEKSDGQMIAGKQGARANRKRFVERLGIGLEEVVSSGLVHGNRVKKVGRKERGGVVKGVDGLLTKEEKVFLSVTVGDCLPLFFFDPRERGVGVVHAGWRGLEKGIPARMVEKMKSEMGCRPEQILVEIGPGLSVCHFEIKEGVRKRFDGARGGVQKREGKYFLDPKRVAREQLQRSGVKEENIRVSSECTYCLENKYFSYRREGSDGVRSMLAVIGLTKG